MFWKKKVNLLILNIFLYFLCLCTSFCRNLFTLMPSRQVFQYIIAEKALVKVMRLQLVHSGHCNNEPAWKYQTTYQSCNTRTPEQDAVNNNLVTPVSKAMPVDYIHSCLKYVIFISSLLDKQNTRRLKMNVRSIICLRHCFHSCTPPQWILNGRICHWSTGFQL